MIRIEKILTALLLFAIIMGGITLRYLSGKPTIAEDTLTPYYFDKFQRLAQTGRFPANDIWQWAPNIHSENAPPGIAYISLATFKLLKFISPKFKLLDFANLFPIFAFLIWCSVILTIWKLQKKDIDAGIIFLATITFSPAAISLTSFANYTQETIGTFLLFLSLYFISTFNFEKLVHSIVTILTLILLMLTWQQFPILYFVLIPIIIVLCFRHKFQEAARLIKLLAISLIGSELIMKIFIKSNYSVFLMSWDFIYGLWLGSLKDPEFLTAMVRGNWKHTSFYTLYNFYGPLVLGLLIIGILIALNRIKEIKYQIALLAAFIGAVMVFQFEKEKNLALGLFLLPVLFAIESIFEEDFGQDVSRFFLNLKHSRFFPKNILFIALTIALSGGWYFFTKVPEGIAVITNYFPPRPEILVSSQKNSDDTIDLMIQIRNRGGTTFYSDRLWYGLNSGMHIEICGAEILSSEAYSPTSEYTWRHFAVYPFARWGDCYFVEIKFKQFSKNQWGEAKFTIKPINTKIQPLLYYRGWMAETSCIIKYKNASGETEEEQELIQSEGEPCIIRTPKNTEVSNPICPVRVNAARTELQNFRCFKLEL